MKNLIYVLRDFAEDFLIIAGLVIINYATFQLHYLAGMYCLGATMMLVGFTIARYPPRKE